MFKFQLIIEFISFGLLLQIKLLLKLIDHSSKLLKLIVATQLQKQVFEFLDSEMIDELGGEIKVETADLVDLCQIVFFSISICRLENS